MNFKQKLGYMLIGCLFTIAGYIIASLANNQLQDAHSQNEKEVIDEIVCRRLKVVGATGEPAVVIRETLGLGSMTLHNGKQLLSINSSFIDFSNSEGKKVLILGANLLSSAGYIQLNNAQGKDLVSISAIEGRPNDGLINVYNHKGEWRSISKD